MTIFVVFGSLSVSAVAGPLESATQNAAVTCYAVGAESLELCGDVLINAPGGAAARLAVDRVIWARATFMDACKADGSSYRACDDMADLAMGMGLYRASLVIDKR